VAKLGFVFVPVVKTLYTVVCPPAPLMFWTLLCLCKFAKLWCVLVVVSTVVLDAMEKEAALMVVRATPVWTFKAFEFTQEQVLDDYRLFRDVVSLFELYKNLSVFTIAIVVDLVSKV
jgi:hypothetical protein